MLGAGGRLGSWVEVLAGAPAALSARLALGGQREMPGGRQLMLAVCWSLMSSRCRGNVR